MITGWSPTDASRVKRGLIRRAHQLNIELYKKILKISSRKPQGLEL